MSIINFEVGAKINDAHKRMKDWETPEDKAKLISESKKKHLRQIIKMIKRDYELLLQFEVSETEQDVFMKTTISFDVDESIIPAITESHRLALEKEISEMRKRNKKQYEEYQKNNPKD